MARFPTILACFIAFHFHANAEEGDALQPLELIRLDKSGTGFQRSESGEAFTVWGVNYDHDEGGKLLEEYWHNDWGRVVEDFKEIKKLGANVVRIHLQVAAFMETPERPNGKNLDQLSQLVRLSEKIGLYLDLTGLGCYRKADVPKWYADLGEAERWRIQATFWGAIAKVCSRSPAIFCYDLMNEPIIPGADRNETDWLAGEFGDFWFVQRIALKLEGRRREDVAKAWCDTLIAAIRAQDKQHMITVGVIPWAHTFPKAKPLFYSPEASKELDFVSVHFYPKKGEVKKALEALRVYDVGKPIVIEETFPLHCSSAELLDFIDASRPIADGWISFYWGRTADEYVRDGGSVTSALKSEWLRLFQKKAASISKPNLER